MRIGFFDSGIGGITVLYEAIKYLPEADYIYYADTKNVPYGIKPKKEVEEYIHRAVKHIIDLNVDALVIACNTATSIAIKDLRNKYDLPIIGMEPAVKPAVEKNGDKEILVLATHLTLREEKYQNLVFKLDPKNIIKSLPLPELVNYAENFQFNNDVKWYIKDKLNVYNLNLFGTIILGCTHFVFFKDIIKQIIPDNIEIIDGNIGTVKHLKNILIESSIFNKNRKGGKIDFYTSGKKESNKIIKKYFNILMNINRSDYK